MQGSEVSNRKRRIFRLLTLLIGIVAGLTIAEIGLRIAGWPAPGFYLNGRGPLELRVPGHEGGAFPSNSHGRLRHYDYDVEWLVNSEGFRERELQPKSKGEWRIGLLGDSFAAGVGVGQNDRFGEAWYAEVYQHTPNVTLWNLAAPLCGTACEADILDGVAPKYELDEIVLAFYGGNDVEDNVDWRRNASGVPSNTPTFFENSKGWLREHSRLATFVWVNAIRGFATFRPPGIYSESDLQRLWPDTEIALSRSKQAVGARRLTILYLPAIAEWDDSVWQGMRKRYGVSDERRYIVKQALTRWAEQNAIDLVDATAWLHDGTSAKEVSFPVDGHWKAVGHLLVARGFAKYWMNARGLTKQADLQLPGQFSHE